MAEPGMSETTPRADVCHQMDSERREAILAAYRARSTLFDAVAAHRRSSAPLPPPPPSSGGVPSRRELDVLALVAEGQTNAEIGARLHVASETVKSHVQAILEKLGARNRAHAVAIAIRRGLLEPELTRRVAA